MHIVYIHQYFKTPEEGGAIRSYYLAKGLSDAGHRVDLITAHNESRYKKVFIDGIHVHYLPVSYQQSFGFRQRIESFLQFVIMAASKASEFKDADLCYATSTPLTVGLVARYLKWKHQIPYIFEVRDLWPEAPIQMGAIRRGWMKQLLYRMEKKIYREARSLVALSPGVRDYIRNIVPSKPCLLLPNIADCDFFRKSEKNAYHELQFDVPDKFVVTYFGAIGKVNHLQYMLEAAEACQRQGLQEVAFLIAGEGSQLDHIRQLAEEKQLENIRFVSYQNKYGLLSLLNVTDAAYIGFADLPVLQNCSPNKLFDALAAGKLCIVNTDGWLRQLVEKNQCGFYAHPRRPEDFVRQIADFVNDRSLLDSCQHNARSLAEREFSRRLQVEKLLAFTEDRQRKAKAYTLPA
ncbi:MAG: glycosyltransferase family 4 protein [Cyclobacteriaceae bacterium]